MLNEIVALAEAQAKTAARRIAVPAAFALVAGLFVLFAVAGLFAALFFWLEPEHGPIAASLICTGVAIILAILGLLPLAFKRRPARQPPPEVGLPQFVSLMARTAPGLGPRQILVAAALLGAALVFTARGNKK
jgi:putative superfamily III holin-X